jgi:hypothetical protein
MKNTIYLFLFLCLTAFCAKGQQSEYVYTIKGLDHIPGYYYSEIKEYPGINPPDSVPIIVRSLWGKNVSATLYLIGKDTLIYNIDTSGILYIPMSILDNYRRFHCSNPQYDYLSVDGYWVTCGRFDVVTEKEVPYSYESLHIIFGSTLGTSERLYEIRSPDILSASFLSDLAKELATGKCPQWKRKKFKIQEYIEI